MFDWKNFLKTAEFMHKTVDEFPDREACYRTVVSRAYYAAFKLSVNYVSNKYNTKFFSNEHKEVQVFFKKKKHDNAMTKIGSQLTRLHQDRKKADYDEDMNESAAMKAAKSLRTAQSIIEGIDALSS